MSCGQCPLVTVIVPAYNSSAFIDESLESVKKQTYRPIEVIIVDDGSTDDTWGKIISFRDRSEEADEITVRCIRQENGGPSRARNAGIRVATGKYLCMLDADDWWPEDKLEQQVRFLEERPTLAMTFGDSRFFRGSDEVVTPSVFRKYGHLVSALDNPEGITGLFEKLLMRDLILTGTEMTRRECIVSVGCYDESLGHAEDVHLWLKLAARYKVGFIDKIMLCRRLHDSNTSRDFIASNLNGLRAIESIRILCPEQASQHWQIFRRKLRDIHFTRGYYLFSGMKLREARAAFRASLRYQVTRSGLIYWASTFLPTSLIHRIRAFREGAGHMESPGA
ncbi:glycosyltransferase family A protein [Geobacter sp.]|uniref:glycosyltransferase family 2 protein n=1 Tax=Geobacter sp. TaxID=46610 RepID=UPI0027B927D0|nr:glycosyltransferase family A protein [Geobacter sp.]